MKTKFNYLKPFLAILLLHFFAGPVAIAQTTSGGTQSGDPNSQTVYANVAVGKTAMASSVEVAPYDPVNAFDGNMSTRYSSSHDDNQWLSIDLGKPYLLDKVIITWEEAYASDFNILFSNNGSFTDLYEDSIQVRNHVLTFNSIAGIDSLILKKNTIARYVKMQGIKRATPNGYSIWEMQVMGATSLGALTPVSLTNFAVAPVDNSNTNMLDWVVITEYTNAGFSIERSSDAINFNSIGWVKAVNAGTVATRYSFTDRQPAAGKNYYRLKQIWQDGKTGYSPVIIMNLATNSIVSTYPVPVKDRLLINYKGTTGESITITLYNIGGAPVYTTKMNVQAGQQTITINRTAAMGSGQYFLGISSSTNKNYMEKIVLQ